MVRVIILPWLTTQASKVCDEEPTVYQVGLTQISSHKLPVTAVDILSCVRDLAEASSFVDHKP